ncbi:MAG: 3-hydroxyacyl-ACP dehydratase FabZ [Clostridiales bacterium]|nr:3-hydroxyacyl-ACP dehydratase FabZ [Clostridiales bacterium]
MEYNINEIEKILPHRYPFLLVDRIIDGEKGSWAKGIKCVSASEEFFEGHFPGYKVMPGVLILEAMAQVGAVALLSMEEYKGRIALFAGVDELRFKRQVLPGDVLEMTSKLTKLRGSIGFAEAEARVDGELAASAKLIFAIQ